MFARGHLAPRCHAPRSGSMQPWPPPALTHSFLAGEGLAYGTPELGEGPGPRGSARPFSFGPVQELGVPVCGQWPPWARSALCGGRGRRALQWWAGRVWEIIGGRVSKPRPPTRRLLIIKLIFKSPS